jgi:hypothetical protein
VALSFVNIALVGLGAHVWGANTLYAGIVVVLMGIPVFLFRHYVQDKGKYPEAMVDDMQLGDEQGVTSRAGSLPYVALGAAALIVLVGHLYASS